MKAFLIMSLLLNVAVGAWAIFTPLSFIAPIVGCINFMVAGGLITILAIDL